MANFFSHASAFFTVWGYSMSYLEFFGTVTGVLAVWLASRAHIWSWPVGIVSVTLFFCLFYQLQLYPDMFLQVFFFVANIMGWRRWTHPGAREADPRHQLKISLLTKKETIVFLLLTCAGTLVSGMLASRLHEWLPFLFKLPSSFPYTDSFVLAASIAATPLMVNKKLECWIIWLLVDITASALYFVKGIYFVGIEYAAFCFIALYGLYFWRKKYFAEQS
ncbi:MAG: nicotinamide mononucleotide transporter [Candidatus Nephrothrix sp. EaCA]|nr:MAG: nicotinamide mononucleotide transporter [Candidatus Nephrothrix sp. EaCA]